MPRRATSTTPAASAAAAEAVPWPDTFTDGLPLPKMIVFDLDYTLWPFWVDTHVSSPLKAQEGGAKVKDRWGESFGFYHEVGGILEAARQKGIKIGVASRTHAPDLAREMLRLLRVPASNAAGSSKAIEYFDYVQIFPGSKTTHFERIQRHSGTAFDDMLFFDDEPRNRNVEGLGVVMWLVRDGVTRDEVDRAVESWRKRTRRL